MKFSSYRTNSRTLSLCYIAISGITPISDANCLNSCIGELNGYDAVVSNNIRADYTKGTSAGVCSGMAFGNWADLLIGLWGGLDLLVDPYTKSLSGARRVVALQDCDIKFRHPDSFSVAKDILTA